MPNQGSAKRYAEVIFTLAQEHQEMERWTSGLETIIEFLGNQDLKNLLESPDVELEAKIKVIKEILAQESPLLQNLLSLLTSRKHLRLTAAILEEYQRLANAALGIEIAQVVTAVPLDPEERAQISERLSQMVERDVRIQSNVDPLIIGGFVARVGDKLVDGSTQTRIRELHRQLTTGVN
jgi:F-type H+-transporting ATPase subunit delta